jgi:N-acetylmuramoyl-L-alanine amidase
MDNLTGKNVAIIVGHEPGGGAAGERAYNMALSVIMRDILRDNGAHVYLHTHHTKAYGQRMREMRAAIKLMMPDCDACVELHFNGYYKESANGHEFLYRGV